MGSRYTLREIFQLRKLATPQPRAICARLFYWAGEPGLTDSSGAVWPVRLRQNSSEPHGGQAAHPLQASEWSLLHLETAGGLGHDEAAGGQMEFVGTSKTFPPALADEGGVFQTGSNPFLARAIAWRDREFARSVGAGGGPTQFWRSTPFPAFRHHQQFHRARKAAVSYFMNRGYLNLEAPVLVRSGGIERYLDLFETRYLDFHGREHVLQLPTSPEFSLKKLVAQGYPRVFSVAPSFRNRGELSDWHRPQFSMLEWYTAGQTLTQLIDQTVELVQSVAVALGSCIEIDSCTRDSQTPRVVSVSELYAEHFNLDLSAVLDDAPAFLAGVRGRSVSVRESDLWDDLFWKSFLDVIEPTFRDLACVVVTEFPSSFASLAAPSERAGFANRFEMFMHGVEVCNGYFELTDPGLMRSRFADVCAARPELRRDSDFESALDFGLQPCAGNALGLDRLVSVLLGQRSLSHTHGLEPSDWGV